MVQKEVWLENGSEAIHSERRNGSDWQRLGKKWLLTSKKQSKQDFESLLWISSGLLFL